MRLKLLEGVMDATIGFYRINLNSQNYWRIQFPLQIRDLYCKVAVF